MSEQAPSSHNKAPEAELADHVYGTLHQIADTAIIAGYDVMDRDWYNGDGYDRVKHITLGSYGSYPLVELSVPDVSKSGERSPEEPQIWLHLWHEEPPEDNYDKYFDENDEPRYDEDDESQIPTDVDVMATQYAVFKVDYEPTDGVVSGELEVERSEELQHFPYDDGSYPYSDSKLITPEDGSDNPQTLGLKDLEELNKFLVGLLEKVQAGPENK